MKRPQVLYFSALSLIGLLLWSFLNLLDDLPPGQVPSYKSTTANPVLNSRGAEYLDNPEKVDTAANSQRIHKATESSLSNWLARYQRATNQNDPELLAEGIRIAEERTSRLKAIIESDPAKAFDQMLTLDEYASLPDFVGAVIEQPFSDLVRLEVSPVCAGHDYDGPSMIRSVVKSDGTRLKAYTFGNRSSSQSKAETFAFGFSLDGLAVIASNPIFPFKAKRESIDTLFPEIQHRADPLSANMGHYPALAGDTVFYFESEANRDAIAEFLIHAEQLPGPKIVEPIIGIMSSASGLSLPYLYALAERASNDWTESPKNILFIRVDFSDKPGSPVDDTTLSEMITTSSDALNEMSFGKTSIIPTIAPTIYRLPQTSIYYDGSDGTPRGGELRDDAAALAAVDYTISDFDIVCYIHTSLLFSFSGIAVGDEYVLNGAQNSGIQSFLNTNIHELGHVFGILHSSSWTTSDDSIGGLNGTLTEYGDPFDYMGGGNYPEAHFNMATKYNFNWIEGPNVATPTTTGMYRIYRFDDANTTGTTRALRIQSGSSETYWLGLRRKYAYNERLSEGAYLYWEEKGSGSGGGSDGRVLDATPTSDSFLDAALSLGQSFEDPSGEIVITPAARGGEAPNEYLDVFVAIGDQTGNNAPSGLAVTGPNSGQARTETLSFSAIANDADGDRLFYNWDFGDGTAPLTGESITKVFSTEGSFTLSVTVSDGRGESVQTTHLISISDPSLDFEAISYSGTIFDMAYGNGVYVTAPLFNGRYSSNAVDWSFTPTVSGNMIGESVCFGSSEFISVGYHAPSGTQVGAIAQSTDGTSWSIVHSGGPRLEAVHYANGIYVAIGEAGTILTSTDGTTWTSRSSDGPVTEDFFAVTYGEGAFVISGASGVLQRSTDGITWTDVSIANDDSDFYALTYGNGSFVALSNLSPGNLTISEDGGLTWQRRSTSENYFPRMLTYANGGYLGIVNLGGASTVIQSYDLRNWYFTEPFEQNGQSVNGIRSLNGKLFVFGNSFLEGAIGSESSVATILEQPLDQTLSLTSMLRVTAISEHTISYQWYAGTTGVTSQPVGTGAASYLPNAAGEYWVRITANGQSVDSRTATVSANTEPAFISLADIETAFNTAAIVTLDYDDAETPDNDLSVSISSSNPYVLPPDNFSISGNQLTLRPGNNAVGSSIIDLFITDSAGSCVHGQFIFSVNAKTSADPIAFTKNDEILILNEAPDLSSGDYPSALAVSGLGSSIDRVELTLSELEIAQPWRLRVLLQSPSGAHMIPLSNIGGFNPVNRATLTFSDQASAALVKADPIVSGTYLPSEGLPDPQIPTFAAPAPNSGFSHTFSVFDMLNPNGTWNLYADDASGGDPGAQIGSIQSWTLTIWDGTEGITPTDTWLSSLGLSTTTDLSLDNDGNGLSYLLEYAMGLTPGDHAEIVRLVDSSGNFYFEYNRRSGNEHGLAYVVETSEDLIAWSPLPDSNTTFQEDIGNGMERVRTTLDQAPLDKQFIRLKVIYRP